MVTRTKNESLAEKWAKLSVDERNDLLNSMPPKELERILYDWSVWARPDQMLPEGNWFCWALISGRGAGKTRTGSETVKQWVGGPKDPPIRIALVAESAPDARDVMVEGESGILTISPPNNRPIYQPSKRRLTWPNGSVAITFSGDKPDQLRGPQFHKAWVDEIAKFQYPEDVWDNLELGLRLGTKPQAIVTTTPRPIKLIRDLLNDPLTIVSRVSTYENIANLAPTFIRRVISKYEGTRLGRQELHAEVLNDTPGALWSYDLIEQNRLAYSELPPMVRVVIGIDPATSANEDSDETGIVVCGKGVDGKGYVLRDASGVYSPEQWSRVAMDLYREFGAARIIAEINQGGDMVERIIRTRNRNIAYRGVRATKARQIRAEPISAMMEQGRIKHAGQFAKMEDQMVITTPEGFLGTGSPDRMDAMVWAMTDLMYGAQAQTDPDAYADYKV